ncbi:MAG: guanine deaminase [Actinomycetota bacterium]|nr:guanine deaminase [Actinomycetota bacterium]MDP2288866.1 guanine deaminase [Actinomycetota bacterium]
MTAVHRGQIFHVAGQALVTSAVRQLEHFEDGALVVDDAGVIAWCGSFSELPAQFLGVAVEHHKDCFLLPGFIDTHMHFPQVWSADSYGGGQLLEWLNECIFPAESRLADPEFAHQAAVEWCDRMITAGTTMGLIFGSAFAHAQDSLFSVARERGLRLVSGRGIQTVGPASAAALLVSEADAIALTRAEIEKWHPLDDEERKHALQFVAVVPRFSLSVTRETLLNLGELYDEYRGRGVYFTSHLSENARPGDGEIDAVKAHYAVDNYLDTYDGKWLPGSAVGGKSFLGPRSVMAHAVHCTDSELARMAATRTSISHCPVSQLFLGSGTMPWTRTVASGVNISMGSDIGGGDEWFMPQILNAAFKQHISERSIVGIDPAPSVDESVSLHPAEMLFAGTLAGARALDLEDRIGNFDAGKEADFVVLDPSAWDMYDQSLRHRRRHTDPESDRDALLFTLLMMAREKALTKTYVRGRKLETSTYPR